MNEKRNSERITESTQNIADMTTSLTKMGFRGIDMSMELANQLIQRFNQMGSGKKNCHCNDTYDAKFIDEVCGDCMPCGAPNSTTDLKLVGRTGEIRKMSIVIENNLNKTSDYVLEVAPLMDQCGKEFDSKEFIMFSKRAGSIEACDSIKVDFFVKLDPKLTDNNVYFTEIKIDGTCCSNKFSLGIWIKDDRMTDHLVLCDPCRSQKSELVQFNNCNCCDGNYVHQGKKYYRLQ